MSGGGSDPPEDASGPYYEFLARSGQELFELYKDEFLPLELQNTQLASDESLAKSELLPSRQRAAQTELDSYQADQQVYDQYGRPAQQASQQYAQGYYDTARAGLDVTAGQNELARQAQGLQGRDLQYQGNVLDSMNRELGLRGEYQGYQGDVLQGQRDRLGAQNALQAGQLGLQGQEQGIQRQALEQQAAMQGQRGRLAQGYLDYQGGQLDVAESQQQRALEASGLQQNQIAARQQMLDGAGPNYDYATGKAAADYAQAEDRAQGQLQRSLEQRGVDPSSGQYQQSLARSFSGQRAAGINAARERERNTSFDKMDRATGDYRAGLNYNAAQATTGATSQGQVGQTQFDGNVAGQNYRIPGVSTNQALPGQMGNAAQSPQSNAQQQLGGGGSGNFDAGQSQLAQGARGLQQQYGQQLGQHNQESAARGQAGASAGAVAGGLIGSAFPVVGTAAGAAIGGAAGSFLAGYAEGGMPAAQQQRGGRLVQGQSGLDMVAAQVANPDGSFDATQLSNNEYVMDAEMVEGIVRHYLNQQVAGLNKRLV